MKTLKDVQKLAHKLLSTDFEVKDIYGNTHILNAEIIGYSFKFDSAKIRFGCCDYTTKTISLSKHMCEINLHQIDGKIKDTILHEIAHAFCSHIYGRVNGRGHDHKWKKIAKQIGSDGKPCFSYEDFGGINMPQSKYTLTCPTCGKELPMHRKPKLSYACDECCTDGFDPKYKLVLTQNY